MTLKIVYKDHYDENYWLRKKTYNDNGVERVYSGPSLVWDGFDFIADGLQKVLTTGSLLDIGCSGGDLSRRLMRRGFDCYGIDISKYAVDNCVPEMKGRLRLCDITQKPDLNSIFAKDLAPFHVLMATDLLEHIYEEDLPETFQWMVDNTKKWMFFCVATAQNPASPLYEPNKHEFVARKGYPIPPEWEATAIAGHVNVRGWQYWVRYFMKHNLKIRWDLMYLFQMEREMNKPWRDTGGWNMSCTWILEK